MDHAIILAYGTGLDDEDLSRHGELEFGSLPQIKRLVITAQRAGIKTFTILTESNDPPLKRLLEGDKRIVGEIRWNTPGDRAEAPRERILLLQSNLVATPEGLSGIIDSVPAEQDYINILSDVSEDAWVRENGNGKVSEIYSRGGLAVGAISAPGTILDELASQSWNLKHVIRKHADSNNLVISHYSGAYWMRLRDEDDARSKAEDLIFKYVGKTATGWISRNINSKISLPTSRILIKTPLTPNMISVGINIIGLFCGIFYAIGHPVLGALCMHIATILDRSDGEVARVKLMETKRGQWVDTISDQFTVLSFLIGVPLGYYFLTNNPVAIVLGAVNLSIFTFFVIWSFYFLSKYTDSGSLVAYFEVDKLVEEKKTSGIRKLIKIVRPLGRRNVYSLGFLVLAIIGGYPWVLGITTAALILFLIHQLEDIIKLRKVKPENSTFK